MRRAPVNNMSIKGALVGGLAGCSPTADSIPAAMRKRPVRTYGRRTTTTSTRGLERPPPQRAGDLLSTKTVEDATPEPDIDEDTIVVALSGDSEPSRSPSPSTTTPDQPNRGSILSYFKPVGSRHPVESPQPSAHLDEVDGPALSPSPPGSPLPVFVPRKRRRLTTRPELFSRPDVASILQENSSTATDEHRDAATMAKTDKKKSSQDISPKGAHGAPFIAVSTTTMTTTYSTSHSLLDENRPSSSVLDPTDPAFANLSSSQDSDSTSSSSTTSTSEKKPPATSRKKRKKDLVQTTLSLAINPGPGFTICKDCGILYNPLNENDRKEHKRRHAAHVRSKTNSGKAKA